LTQITLLSDFGLVDPFVGLMKSAVLTLCPTATLVDLTHDLEPQDIRGGAFWLERCSCWFARGTVHLAVVDPGVGTSRPGVVLEADQQLYVGPHNGLFDRVIRRARVQRLHLIELQALGIARPSATFHGRDVFGPVAGLLASGRLSAQDVGPEMEATPALGNADRSGQGAGEVVVVDRFGNLITDIECTADPEQQPSHVQVAGFTLALSRSYAEVAPGELLALVNSFGTIEIAVREGSARQKLGLGRGTPVTVK